MRQANATEAVRAHLRRAAFATGSRMGLFLSYRPCLLLLRSHLAVS